MAGSAGRVRDPIHGYIAFTGIERTLFDHPVAQRLRSVSQSAAAHLVFPEMRVSRFAHSLGAMHLASGFLTAALRNASEDVRAEVVRQCHALVDKHQGMGLGGAEGVVLAEPALLAGTALPRADRVAVAFVEQALRLASLVHDLGHLPFSHDFELALGARRDVDDVLRARLARLNAPEVRGEALHEKVGYALAATVQQRVFDQELVDGPAHKVAEVSFFIARDVLDAPAAPELDADALAQVLTWLHSLVASEVDVDRADYVLRDVRAYGLHAAGYDLDRLVESIVPVRRADGALVTAILPPGVSAAESFFVARFRMYVWAIFHHKIQQAAAGLRVAIEDVLEHADREIEPFFAALTAIAGGDATDDTLLEFAEYDDVWFTGLMRQRLRDGLPVEVEPWSALFLRRRPGPVSLWKRPSDFPLTDRVTWNRRLPEKDDTERRAEWNEIARQLRHEGLLVHRFPFRPWDEGADGESELQVAVGEGLEPLTRLAPLVGALREAWADALQVHVFAARAELAADPLAILQRLEPALQPTEEPQA